MRSPIRALLVLVPASLAAAEAQAQDAAGHESKPHEYACIAATVGGTVAGIAAGSLLGAGLGTILFENAGGAVGGAAGRMLKCPHK